MNCKYNSSLRQASDWKTLRLCDPLVAIVPCADVLRIANGRVHVSIISVDKVSQSFYTTLTLIISAGDNDISKCLKHIPRVEVNFVSEIGWVGLFRNYQWLCQRGINGKLLTFPKDHRWNECFLAYPLLNWVFELIHKAWFELILNG